MSPTEMSPRETWLNAVADRLRPTFADLGWPLPERLRIAATDVVISDGAGALPPGLANRGKLPPGASVQGYCTRPHPETGEVFITVSPLTRDPAETLAHELVHAAVGAAAKHGPEFAKLAGQLGLRRPWRATTAGPKFDVLMRPILDELGPCPNAKLHIRSYPEALTGLAADIRKNYGTIAAGVAAVARAVKRGMMDGSSETPAELLKVSTDTGHLLLAARSCIESESDWLTWCLQNVPAGYPFVEKMMEMAREVAISTGEAEPR